MRVNSTYSFKTDLLSQVFFQILCLTLECY